MKCLGCHKETVIAIYCFFCYCEVTNGGKNDPPLGWKAAYERSKVLNGEK